MQNKSRLVIGIDSNILDLKNTLFNNKIEHLSNFDVSTDVYPFQKYYRGTNKNCGVFWLINCDTGDMILNNCKQFSCQRCRPKKIAGLRDDLIRELRENNLGNRLDMTLMGKEFRSKITAEDSYAYHNKKFNQIARAIKVKYGEFEYISLRRSQQDGYCHSHTFFPKDLWIDKDWMEKRARGNKVGWCRFRKRTIEKNVHYVAGHFTSNPRKIGEFYIPKGKKHIATSQKVVINKFSASGSWKKIDTRDILRKSQANEFEAISPIYEHYTGIADVPIEPFFNAWCQAINEDIFGYQKVM